MIGSGVTLGPDGLALGIGRGHRGASRRGFARPGEGRNRRLVMLVLAGTVALLTSFAVARPADAAYPGTNGKIAWMADGPPGSGVVDIWTMNADGTVPTNLLSGGVDEEQPAWSPDGRRIAFARVSGSPSGCGVGDIYVMDVDGSNVTQLTTNSLGTVATEPTWSPDGTRIAYTLGQQDATCNDGDSEIWMMNADGTGQTAVTSGGIGIYNGDGEPAWSPDGTKIAFTGWRGASGNQLFGIFTINPDGSGITRLTGYPISFVHTYSPAWSPDGQRIAYERSDAWTGSDEIWVMNADGSGHTAVTQNGFLTNWSPAWSPDGQQIAFSGQDDQVTFDNEIFVINVDGTGQTAITNNTTGDSYPDWQPLPANPLPVNVVTTFAGDGTLAFGGDGGSALAAQTNFPYGIAVAPDGTVYFSDSGNYRIRKIDPTGVITTVAGTGAAGSHGDNGPATSATFLSIFAIALDATTNDLYVSDLESNRVRRIDLDTGDIFAFAGTGIFGFSGDGGAATSARLSRPEGVAVAADGSVVIADTENCRIRRVSGGVITTIAGSGPCDFMGNGGPAISANFFFPRRVAFDDAGNLFVGEGSISGDDDTVRRIDALTGDVDLFAGGGTATSGSGPATAMDIGNVNDLATDAFGNLYIGSLHRVFRVDLASGLLSPYAGTGNFGYSGDGGNALDADFNGITGIAVTGDTLLISDGGNSRVRVVAPEAPASGDVVVTDCADPALAGLTVVTGNLVVQNVADCEGVSLPNLTQVSGDVSITGNDAATVIGLAQLGSVAGDVTITGNGSAAEIDLGVLTNVGGAVSLSGNASAAEISLDALLGAGEVTVTDNDAATVVSMADLGAVAGDVTITGNGSAAEIDLGALVNAGSVDITDNSSTTVVSLVSLGEVAGDVELETAGTVVDMGSASVAGEVTLTGLGAGTVSATTGGGSTEVTLLGGTAAMHVLLPAGTFEQPVAFTIERQADGPAELGTTAEGAAAVIDPLAGYRFNFAVPTLNQQAQLSFTIDLAQLDPDTRAALLAGVADGSATLVVKGDEAGAAYDAIALCAGTQTPAADGCVTVVPLDLAGGPVAPGAEPTFVRFEGVAGHFSTWAIALVEPQDSTPPAITPTVVGTLGTNGWHTSDVSVSWTVEDSESAITQQSGCEAQTVSADTAGVTFTCEATSAGGTATQSVTIKRDTTAPTITGSRAPAANASGWDNGDVTVSFVCADALSGVASCSTPTTITTDGANQSVTGTATDVAGNQATATVGGINIDRTAPSCTASASPNRLWPPNHKLMTVNVSVVMTDSLSGAAGFTLLSVTSNEPDDGPDDGDTVNDIQGFTIGTADTVGKVRAERSGSGSGRVYTITYQVMDLAANSATCAAQVIVPLE